MDGVPDIFLDREDLIQLQVQGVVGADLWREKRQQQVIGVDGTRRGSTELCHRMSPAA